MRFALLPGTHVAPERAPRHEFLFLAALLLPALPAGSARADAPELGSLTAWREEYAYTLGVQAYLYGYPLVYNAQLRHKWVTDPKSELYAPFNHFSHHRKLADASYKDGGSPNNDTLYSIAWLDLSREPVILSVPDTGDRYYTMELADFYSDNFAYVGRRTTGSKAGAYLIAGPGWKGDLPQGVKGPFRSPTPYALIIGRTLVDGPTDVPNVVKLQEQYLLTPLSLWGKPDRKLPERRDTWPPFDPKQDPLADFKTMNRALSENPPPERDGVLIKTFATVGIGPGLPTDLDKLDAAAKRGLARAIVEGQKLILQVARGGAITKEVNGWRYPPPVMGRAGPHGDFLTRAALQSFGGITANDPEEAVYLFTITDADGKLLTGNGRYVLRFGAKQVPSVGAFWSVTMYGLDRNLVDNPINRYSLGDRSSGLK